MQDSLELSIFQQLDKFIIQKVESDKPGKRRDSEKVAATAIAPFMEKVNRRTIIGPCFAFCAVTSGLCGYFFYIEGSLLVPGRWISFVAMLAISGNCSISIFFRYMIRK